MALNKQNVKKAVEILKEISGVNITVSIPYQEHERIQELNNVIIKLSPKSDGGYENVFLRIKNPSASLLRQFEVEKKSIINSSFCNNKGDNIWHIGWF